MSGQRVLDTTGAAARFDLLVPKLGLVRGRLEGYNSQSRLRSGDNYIEVPAIGWQSMRWSLTGGDYRVRSTLTGFQFPNLLYPEFTLRGGKITATQGRRQYTIFHGEQTLQSGPRIPVRLGTGQRISGAEFRIKGGEGFEFGVRLTDIRNRRFDELVAPWFGLGRQYSQVSSLNAQLFRQVLRRLKLFAEAGVAKGTSLGPNADVHTPPASLIGGAAWESEKFTLRANYSRQNDLYLPVAGFYVSDRKGPHAELRYRPVRAIEVFGSTTIYRNNLGSDSSLPTYWSRSQNGGMTVLLPGRLTVSGQISRLTFDARQPDIDDSQRSNHRIGSVTIGRPIGKHGIRITVRDLRLVQPYRVDRQRSHEFEDTFQWRNFVLGGAVRFDKSLNEQRRNTMYGRFNGQARFRRVTGYAYVEAGRDLVNESLLATNGISSTVAGVTVNIASGWTWQTEAFRYSLRSVLNPGSAFALQSQGARLPSTLAGLNQWSFYTRLNKELRWGAPLPTGGRGGNHDSDPPAPGAVEGFVFENADGKRSPVAGVALDLDGSVPVTTSAEGRYRFPGVPEGPHRVALVADRLPAEYDPAPGVPDYILIHPGRTTRLDFTVFRLASTCGTVIAPPSSGVEQILIRLESTSQYTSPEPNGTFCFHNLRPGQYVASLFPETIAKDLKLVSPERVAVTVRQGGGGSDPARFVFEQTRIAVPVRKVLQNRAVTVELPRANPTPPTVVPPPARAPAARVAESRSPEPPPPSPTTPSKEPRPPPPTKPAEMGRMLAKADRHEEAIKEFDEALRRKPDDAKALNARGFANLRLGRPAAAIADFSSAIRLDAQYANAYHNRAVARRMTGDMKGFAEDSAAEQRLQVAYEPRPAADGLAEMGRTLAKADRLDEAIRAFDEALRQAPDDARTLNARGFAKLRLGRTAAAIADFSAAIRLDPQYANAYHNRAVARRMAGDQKGFAEDSNMESRLSPRASAANPQSGR